MRRVTRDRRKTATTTDRRGCCAPRDQWTGWRAAVGGDRGRAPGAACNAWSSMRSTRERCGGQAETVRGSRSCPSSNGGRQFCTQGHDDGHERTARPESTPAWPISPDDRHAFQFIAKDSRKAIRQIEGEMAKPLRHDTLHAGRSNVRVGDATHDREHRAHRPRRDPGRFFPDLGEKPKVCQRAAETSLSPRFWCRANRRNAKFSAVNH